MKKGLFIVEDHAVMRQTYELLFADLPDLAICGSAGSAEEALTAIPRARPDLALVDISLPGRSGLQLVGDLRRDHPEVRVLVLSGHDGDDYVREAARAGADGFVTKGDFQQLLAEIRRILSPPPAG